MPGKPSIVLYLPQMWEELYTSLNLKLPSDADWDLKSQLLDIERTGPLGDGYDQAQERRQKGDIPILLLPVAHCAESIETKKLSVLGPAVHTKNDIFVFRGRTPRPKKKDLFHIAVREEELTTSNISRVVLNHWCPDTYFFSECDEPDHAHPGFKLQRFKHLPVPSTAARLDGIAQAKYDAAIFMGHELDDVRPSDNEAVIEAANLNQLICNLYNCKLFPRAVFAAFKSDIEQTHKLAAIASFVSLFNAYVSSTRQAHKLSNRVGISQFLCMTGPDADLADVITLQAFTRDMLRPELLYDRGGLDGRSLKNADFYWWNDIRYIKNMLDFIDDLESRTVSEVLQIRDKTPSPAELLRLNKALRLYCEWARVALKEGGRGFGVEQLTERISRLSLGGDEKYALRAFIDENSPSLSS